MKPALLNPTFIRRDKRGDFFEMLNGSNWENLSYGKMKKGAVIGNHYHKKTYVFFFILSGSATVVTLNVKTSAGDSFTLSDNEGIWFEPYVTHAVVFKKESMFLMGKSIAYDKDNPDTYEYMVVEGK